MRYFSTLIIVCLSLTLSAQLTVERQVLSTAGSYAQNGDISIDWTIGQTTSETHEVGDVTLTSGYQQLIQTSVSAIHESALDIALTVFPNPTSDRLSLRSSDVINLPLRLALIDANGREVVVSRLESGVAISEDYDLGHIAAGTYQLVVSSTEGQASTWQVVRTR